VLLVNWQAHPGNGYDEAIGYYNISADHPGWCRDKLAELTGAQVAYFNGASGDLSPTSQIPEVNHGLNAKEYGVRLAEMAYKHYDELKAVDTTVIKTTTRKVPVNVEHELEHLLAQSMVIRDIYQKEGKRAEANAEARKIGLSSCFHASAICRRANLGATEIRELNAFSLGPVGFITCTYEMASEHAMELKEMAPFDTIFIMSGNQRYIPREEAIDYHSYEGDTRDYTRETGDMLIGQFNEMLGQVK